MGLREEVAQVQNRKPQRQPDWRGLRKSKHGWSRVDRGRGEGRARGAGSREQRGARVTGAEASGGQDVRPRVPPWSVPEGSSLWAGQCVSPELLLQARCDQEWPLDPQSRGVIEARGGQDRGAGPGTWGGDTASLSGPFYLSGGLLKMEPPGASGGRSRMGLWRPAVHPEGLRASVAVETHQRGRCPQPCLGQSPRMVVGSRGGPRPQ